MRARLSSQIFVTALSLTALAAACKKAEKTGDGSAAVGSGSAPAMATGSGSAAGSNTAPADKQAEAMGSAAAGSAAVAPPTSIPVSTGEDLALIPVNSELVMGINVQVLQSSAMWKQFVEPQLMKKMSEIEKFKEKCGFNPVDQVKSVSIGLSNLGPNLKPTGAMVVHGFEKAKMMDCLDKMKDEAKAGGAEITRDGDIITVDNKKEGVKSTITFVNDTTMLVAVGGDKDKLMALAKGDTALKSSPMFVDMFGKINSQHTLWGLMNGSSKLFAPAAAANIKFKAVYGSLNITDGLQVDARVRMDSPDQAASLKTMATQQLGKFKAMVDKLDIGTDGSDVTGSVMVSAEKLKSLASLAGMNAGMGNSTPPGP